MSYHRMGSTGLQVLRTICLGTMTFGFKTEEPESHKIMSAAFDCGVSFIDTGRRLPDRRAQRRHHCRLRRQLDAGQAPRPDRARPHNASAPWAATPTSAGPPDSTSSPPSTNPCAACRPTTSTSTSSTRRTPARRSRKPCRRSTTCAAEARIRYAGASNFRGWQLGLALAASDRAGITRFDCDQPRYNILWRDIETDLLPLCRDQGVGIIAYNSLAGGFLTGKYANTEDLQQNTRFTLGNAGPRYRARYWDDAHFGQVQSLQQHFAGRSITHAAIAWVLAQDGITSAIVGASRASQIEDSLNYESLELTAEDLEFCDNAWYNLPRPSDPAVALR